MSSSWGGGSSFRTAGSGNGPSYGDYYGAGHAAIIGGGLGVGHYSDTWNALYGGRSPYSAVRNYAATLPKVIDNKNAEKLRPVIVGQSNQPGQWNRVPLLLGKMTWYPQESARLVMVKKGNGWLANVGYELCYGPVAMTQADIKVGDKTITQVLEDSEDEDGDDAIQYFADGAIASAYTLYQNDNETLNVNQATAKNVQYTRTCPQEADAIILNIQFDNGLYKLVNVTAEDGSTVSDRQATGVSFDVDVRKVGTSTWYRASNWGIFSEVTSAWWVSKTISKSKLEEFYGAGNARGLYEVRLKRNTAVGQNIGLFDQTTWMQLVAVKYSPPYRPIYNSAGAETPIVRLIMSLYATDDLNGTLQQVSVTAQSKVPIWNGSTWSAPTASSNPADLFLWVAKGPFNQRPYTDAELDLAQFLVWRNWCITKGFTFDAIIDREMSLLELFNALAAAGRAKFIRRDGKISIAIDKEQTTVVHHFTAWNILAGSFSFSVEQSKKLHGLKINFLDPLDKYAQAVRRVYNDGYSESNASEFEVVDFFGCANSEMAYKMGRYLLAVQEHRAKLYELSCGWDSLLLTVGDLVRLNHDVAAYGLGSGFVSAVVTNGGGDITHVDLDNPVAITNASQAYSVRFLLSDGTEMLKPVVNPGVGDFTRFQLQAVVTNATSIKPARHTPFLFGTYNATTALANDSRLMIVIAIEPQENDFARIILQEYVDAIYTADSTTIPDYVSNHSQAGTVQFIPPAPTIVSIQSDEWVLKPLGNNVFMNQMIINMAQQTGIKEFEFQYKYHAADNNGWSAKDSIPASAGRIAIQDVEDLAVMDVRVRAVSKASIPGQWTLVTHTVIGKSTIPPNLDFLLSEPTTGKITALLAVKPLDVIWVEYRMNWGNNSNYAQGVLLAKLPFNTPLDLRALGFAAGLKTIMAKAVDVTGRVSATAKYVKTDFGYNSFNPVVIETARHPTFAGTITGGSVDGGQIKSDLVIDAMWPEGEDDDPMWEGNQLGAMWGDAYQMMVYDFVYTVPSTVPPGSLLKLKNGTLSNDNIGKIEYNYVDADAMWFYGDDYEPMWPEEIPTLTEEGEEPPDEAMWIATFLPFPTLGIPAIKNGDYQIRITAYASSFQRVFDEISTLIDIFEITQYRNDVVVASSAWVAPPVAFTTLLKDVSITFQQHPSYPLAVNAVLDGSVSGGSGAGKDKALGARVKVVQADGVTPTTGIVDVVMYGY